MTGVELLLVLVAAGVMAARSPTVRSGVVRAGRAARGRAPAVWRQARGVWAPRAARTARGVWAWGRRPRRRGEIPHVDPVPAPAVVPVVPAPRPAPPARPSTPDLSGVRREVADGVYIERLDKLNKITMRLGEHMDEIRRANAAVQTTGAVTPEMLPEIIGHAAAMGTTLVAWVHALLEYLEYLESPQVRMDRRYTRLLHERAMGVLAEAAGLRADVRIITAGYAAELAIAEGETGHQQINPAVLGKSS